MVDKDAAAPTIVKMPQLGESVVEGTVTRWLKAPGERVAKREPLLDIATDKIDTEIPAPVDGVLLEILVAAGTTVRTGTALAVIGEASDDPLSDVRGSARRAAFVSPVVARMAAQHGVNLAAVAGSGLGGRVTKQDVERYLQAVAAPVVVDEPARMPAAANPGESAATPAEGGVLQPDESLSPLTTMRRAIAQHMVMSKRVSAHVTSVFEADMTAVVRHREAHKGGFAAKGIALTYTPYFVAAVVAGLKAVPEANSRFTEAGIVINRRIHIGVAVALGHGLLAPVLRNADEMNLQGLARGVNDLVERARAGSLTPDDLQGGTFTLTNHGTGGSLFATPIINQPQTAILGAGVIAKRPVVRSSSLSLLPSADDSLVIRPMCFLSLTFDHRALDGAQADVFLTAVKKKLENWDQ